MKVVNFHRGVATSHLVIGSVGATWKVQVTSQDMPKVPRLLRVHRADEKYFEVRTVAR